jgi:serine/threonine-protein kinase RsbW
MAWQRGGKTEKTQITLDSDLHSVDKAEALAIEAAERAGFIEDDQHQIGMAVRECMVNAVVHGNGYNKNKRVHFDIERTATGLTVTIGDEGSGFDLNSLPDPLSPENILRQSGRGLLLVRAFMDSFNVHPRIGGGTEVQLSKNFAK